MCSKDARHMDIVVTKTTLLFFLFIARFRIGLKIDTNTSWRLGPLHRGHGSFRFFPSDASLYFARNPESANIPL